MLWDFPNQSCQNCFYKSLVFDNLTRLFGICDLEKPILTFPPHSILSIQTFKIYLKIRNFLQKVTYDVTHANTETAGSKTSLIENLSSSGEATAGLKANWGRKVCWGCRTSCCAYTPLPHGGEPVRGRAAAIWRVFFIRLTSTWHTDKVFSKRLACFAFAYQTCASHSSRTKKCDK